MAEMRPAPTDRLLDVGVTDSAWRSNNFLEARYPYAEQITAVGLVDMPAFRSQFPTVAIRRGGWSSTAVRRKDFDLGFSNAVIEHVGVADDQRRFVHELVRTCRRVFIATPNAGFPIDPHTLLPFVHWLPRSIRHRVLRVTGNARWASEVALRPIGASELRSFFPAGVPVRIVRQRVLGMTTVLIAIVDRSEPLD